jgi:hypothetical protein
MAEVGFRHVDVVFGKEPEAALKLLDQGESRETILEATGHVLGVADASIAIDPGEICVLMGLSGSGKSTLLRCVNGLNRATRGEVLVDDEGGPVDVAHCDAKTLRRLRTHRIAMVFQQFGLLPWRTVRENVGFGLELRGMNRTERDAVVEEKLKLVHLDQERVHEQPRAERTRKHHVAQQPGDTGQEREGTDDAGAAKEIARHGVRRGAGMGENYSGAAGSVSGHTGPRALGSGLWSLGAGLWQDLRRVPANHSRSV